MKSKDNIIILANGLFPGSRRALDFLKGADAVICCDGAADKLVDFGMEPHVIIGDMDSVSDGIREQYASIMIHSPSQETNDLSKAVLYCIEKGYTAVSLLGATGLREDHTLGNISQITTYFPRIDVRIISDWGTFFLVRSGQQINSFAGEKISLFSIDNSARVTSEGLKYPLENLELSSWYTASLNEAVSDSFTLVFESDLPLIVYRAW